MSHLNPTLRQANELRQEIKGERPKIPSQFVELACLNTASLAASLRYCSHARFVAFGYCHAGDEVLWNDGRSSGFATGVWQLFEEIMPLATRHGVSLDGPETHGTHVLLVDWATDAVYAAPRPVALDFVANAAGLPPPKRQCLCGR